MHYKKLWITSCILAACLTMNFTGTAFAEDAKEGELIFAQCESYINIRSEADENSEVVAKIYHDSAAKVEETAQDGWYKVKSGNAVGYVKAEYFATGDEAKEIAEKVAYKVAVVNAQALNVRATPSEEGDVIDVAEESQELEVVDTSGEWTTVALGNDVYGFIHPDYCEYKTYYPTAVTLEEEAEERRRAEAAAAQADAENTYAEDTAVSYDEEVSYEESTDTSYADETTAVDTSYEDSYTGEGASGDDTDTSADTSYEDSYAGESASGDDTDTSADTSYEDGYTGEDTSYEDSYTGEDTSYDDGTAGGDTSYDEGYVSEEPSYEENTGAESSDTTVSDSSLGQQIADYAVQFVGNPYVYGGTSLTNGTDCSGFTQSVMANFGIYLARTAADQSYGGTSVSLSDLLPGDLLFYSEGSGISHVALYIGGGQIVHAATESQGIIISSAYYSTPVCAARYW